MQQRCEQDEAVSPVIATVLLLAITVLLSSMVFLMFSETLDSAEKSVPQATLSVRSLSNGHHVVKFSSLDQAIDPAVLSYRLAPDNSSMGNPIAGVVADSDVYGVVGGNISFHDRDAGYSVSAGDYFVINSAEIGAENGGWRLTIIDESIDYVLVNIELPPLE